MAQCWTFCRANSLLFKSDYSSSGPKVLLPTALGKKKKSANIPGHYEKKIASAEQGICNNQVAQKKQNKVKKTKTILFMARKNL